MSILSPSGPLDEDQHQDVPPPPTRLAPVSSSSPAADFLDERGSQILAAVVALVAVALIVLVAITFGGSDNESGDDVVTASNPAQNLVETDTDTDIDSAEAGAGSDASLDPVSKTAPTTAPPTSPPTTEAPISSTTTAPPTSPPTTAPPTSPPTTTPTSPPTTAAPATEPPTTEPPTTDVPTTAPPTSEVQTTAAPSSAPTTAAPPPAGGSAAEQVLNLVNIERANAGCGPLTLQSQLNAAALGHSEDMSANNYFSHTGLDGSQPWDRAAAAGYGSRTIGENIAQGYGSAEAVMNGWMNSSGHRANILNCRYNHMGLGLSNQGNYWTQLFGGG